MNGKTNLLIDEYIRQFDVDLQSTLNNLRLLIHELAPNAVETLSYQIPTFKVNGKALVHFAAFKTHIGFYPTPSAIVAFKDQLIRYKTSKGAIQFPLNSDLPMGLIKEMVEFRISEVLKGNK